MCGLGGDTEYCGLRNIKSLWQCWTQRDNFLFLVAQNQCISSRLYIDSLIIKDTEYTWPWNSTRMEQNKTFIQHQQGKHALNPACSSQLHEIFLNLVIITLSFSYLFAFCLLFFSSLALMLPAHVWLAVQLCDKALSQHTTPCSPDTSCLVCGGKAQACHWNWLRAKCYMSFILLISCSRSKVDAVGRWAVSTLRLGLTGATAAELVGLHHSAEQQFVPPSITAKEQSPTIPKACLSAFLHMFSILFQVLCPLLTPTVS